MALIITKSCAKLAQNNVAKTSGDNASKIRGYQGLKTFFLVVKSQSKKKAVIFEEKSISRNMRASCIFFWRAAKIIGVIGWRKNPAQCN